MRQHFALSGIRARENAVRAVQAAPEGYTVTVKHASRSSDQNAMMWALLTDISRQIPWEVYGEQVTLSPDDWKVFFSAHLRQQRVVQGMHGNLVVLGCSTSDLTKGECSDLLELILAFGAERGVVWSDDLEASA